MINRPWSGRQIAFRAVLRRFRKRSGLTQAQLSEKLAKPQSYVSKYETGERRLDYFEVRDICVCCNTTITAFDRALMREARKESTSAPL